MQKTGWGNSGKKKEQTLGLLLESLIENSQQFSVLSYLLLNITTQRCGKPAERHHSHQEGLGTSGTSLHLHPLSGCESVERK